MHLCPLSSAKGGSRGRGQREERAHSEPLALGTQAAYQEKPWSLLIRPFKTYGLILLVIIKVIHICDRKVGKPKWAYIERKLPIIPLRDPYSTLFAIFPFSSMIR